MDVKCPGKCNVLDRFYLNSCNLYSCEYNQFQIKEAKHLVGSLMLDHRVSSCCIAFLVIEFIPINSYDKLYVLGCYKITTVFSHAQTVVLCVGCSTVLCQPTGGKARLTEGKHFMY